MANLRAHVAPVGTNRWLAWRPHCPTSVSSQVTETVVPTRVPCDRVSQLRCIGLVPMDDVVLTLTLGGAATAAPRRTTLSPSASDAIVLSPAGESDYRPYRSLSHEHAGDRTPGRGQSFPATRLDEAVGFVEVRTGRRGVKLNARGAGRGCVGFTRRKRADRTPCLAAVSRTYTNAMNGAVDDVIA
jgi:hypothetical protein